MSSVLVAAALEAALAAMSPALGTAWENTKYQPTVGTPYQRADVLLAEPDDSELTGAVFWEQGIFQIRLYYPLDKGSGAAYTRAELIRQTFYKGASFTSGGVTVIVRKTPRLGPPDNEPNFYVLPVRITFSAQITRS